MGESGDVTELAPAKLNPYLRVLRRRDDGFHDIETIVLPLDLADTVRVRPLEGDRFELDVSGPRAEDVPLGDENLVVRAARALAASAGAGRGAWIEIEKGVPVAAGLGGGSADAAATLRALNRLWGLGLDREELGRIGAGIGSDVPALVPGRAVMATGRGERVTAFEAPPTWWVLVTFDAGISARDAYAWWDRGIRRRLERPGPIEDARRAIASGDPDEIAAKLHNSLEFGVVRRHPSVAAARDALGLGGHPDRERTDGAIGVLVSGSGPTVAGLCRDRDHATRLAETVDGIAVSSIPG